MPNIGDIVHGKELERFPDKIYIWSACTKCGGERWAECRNGEPFYSICFKCSRPKKKVWDIITTEPYLGEIRRSGQIEGYAKCKTRYIWCKCPTCGYEKWRQLDSQGKYTQCRKCMHKGKIGEQNGAWKGGTKINHDGYRLVILRPDDPYYPMANVAGYVMEHRLIIAKQLGRCLEEWELVHHKGINYPIESRRNKSDNVPENLEHIGIKGEHNTLVEATLIRQAKYIKAQDNRIEGLESRVTLLEAELTVFRMDMSEFI
jgi:hypothetical protein